MTDDYMKTIGIDLDLSRQIGMHGQPNNSMRAMHETDTLSQEQVPRGAFPSPKLSLYKIALDFNSYLGSNPSLATYLSSLSLISSSKKYK